MLILFHREYILLFLLAIILKRPGINSSSKQYKNIVYYSCQGVVCSVSRLHRRDKIYVLDKFNEFRNRVAAGLYPNYSYCINNMNKIAWNQSLADMAQKYVNTCPRRYQHNRTSAIRKLPKLSVARRPDFTRIFENDEPVLIDGKPCDQFTLVEFNSDTKKSGYNETKYGTFDYIGRGQMDDFWSFKTMEGTFSIAFRRVEVTEVGCGYVLQHLKKPHKRQRFLSFFKCIYCSYRRKRPLITQHPCTGCKKYNSLNPYDKYEYLCRRKINEYKDISEDGNENIFCATSSPVRSTSKRGGTNGSNRLQSSIANIPSTNNFASTTVQQNEVSPKGSLTVENAFVITTSTKTGSKERQTKVTGAHQFTRISKAEMCPTLPVCPTVDCDDVYIIPKKNADGKCPSPPTCPTFCQFALNDLNSESLPTVSYEALRRRVLQDNTVQLPTLKYHWSKSSTSNKSFCPFCPSSRCNRVSKIHFVNGYQSLLSSVYYSEQYFIDNTTPMVDYELWNSQTISPMDDASNEELPSISDDNTADNYDPHDTNADVLSAEQLIGALENCMCLSEECIYLFCVKNRNHVSKHKHNVAHNDYDVTTENPIIEMILNNDE